ncbi:S8 family peptidase [Kribbella sp.]|uniref:S8 family peptidase n=1 Tax=Kribbella sp. TaxID=1871183 RepID=UPI002D613A07|nr:S8 family peptidase [Kribbella sp.]HZX07764.1 S8 family peptidase [Kribbella sp.]
MRPRWRHPVTAAGVLLCAAAVLSAPASASSADVRPIVGSTKATGPSATVTLITGDRARLTRTSDGQPVVQLLAGPDGITPDYETSRDGDRVYVYPSSAAAALSAGLVDREFFDVTGLVAQGYDDAHQQTIPVIAQYGATARTALAATPTPSGATEAAKALPAVRSVAYPVSKEQAHTAFAELTNTTSRSGRGITKLWLDRALKPTLADSTAQVGAPVAWKAGLDGTGSTVAVLDTGVDAGHPDLAGRIVQSKDFTESAYGTDDKIGHGTHVASTIAGSGAESNGKERGVAPGTKLLIGKVLGDGGSGSESQIIAGMQWAVDNKADAISMSLGAPVPATTCDDPIAQAVTRLSNASSSLFVIAAGNMGAGPGTVSSPGCAPEALTVGAVDSHDATAYFSSRGPVAGTHVEKPELAAPGVAILAANAGGRGVYAYQTMSGTSMATPHVSGAAAIAKQANPSLTGAQLKNLLVSSADPNIPGDVQEVGAGRLDIAKLLTTKVTGPSSVYGGTYAWPQTGTADKTVGLTYTNSGSTPIDLRLSVEHLTGNDGRALNAPLVRVPQHVVVPAKSTATVPVTVRPGQKLAPAALGDVTARIVATSNGQRVSTAFNLYLQPATVSVKVTVLDRAGKPAAGASSVDLINTDTASGERRFNSGATEQVFQVRPGRYYLGAYALTPQAGAPSTAAPASVSYLGRPELMITRDTAIVLDARKAQPLTVSTQRPSQLQSTTLTFERQWPTSWLQSGSMTTSSLTKEAYAGVTGTVAKGDGSFEFGHWTHRIAPIVSSMRTTDGLTLTPAAPQAGVSNLDGKGSAQLVDGGAGSAAELTNAGGKVALVHLAAGASDSSVQATAAKAGVKALLLYRDDAYSWLPSVGFTPNPLPVYSLPNTQGAALAAKLAAGAVTLTWSASASTPYSYTLGFFNDKQLTTAQRHDVRDASLGRITATYNSMGVKTNFGDLTSAMRPTGVAWAVGGIDQIAVPSTRTEYVTADGTSWFKSIISSFPWGEVMSDRYRSLAPGQQVTDSWYGGALAPGIRAANDGTPQLIAERQGSLIGVAPTMWEDSAGHWADQGGFGDLGNLELKRDGVVTGNSYDPWGVFDVPSGDSTYDLTLRTAKIGAPAKAWTRSTSTTTTWTFRSHEEPSVSSRALPLLMPRLDLPADGLKTVAAGSVTVPARFEANPGYDAGALTAAKVWTSVDDGTTWTEGSTELTKSGADLLVNHSGDTGKQVSLRVELTDSHGAKVTQTITRAYDVR